MKKTKELSMMIAIPTCYGGPSLVETVKTVRAATDGKKVRIAIQADRTPLTPKIKQQLKELNAEVYWNKVEGSQFKKLKQLIEKCKEDIFVFTQDDITFDAQALVEIKKAFAKSSKLTMIGSRVLPLKPITKFEASMAVMIRLVDNISGFWNNGKNYLSASGRCLAFRTTHLKTYTILPKIVNGDMYLYLENNRQKGTFKQLAKSIVYIRGPQKLKDQIGPSSRYQFSKDELAHYFGEQISKEYKVPAQAFIKAVIKESVLHPIAFVSYIGIFVYTRLKKQSYSVVSNPVWKVDVSTKNVVAK